MPEVLVGPGDLTEPEPHPRPAPEPTRAWLRRRDSVLAHRIESEKRLDPEAVAPALLGVLWVS